ncbi:terpene synthase family protein [Streptomyces luteolus]|uniref:Terpene synthase n=1 Tax=Streptomyces luteolus TaxID=3043615 RepID=A0ABT6T7Q9_9ACTN|nr:terpene synthase family protein [Streptomyces sp. B-S-A12]MDI3423932.1 terpene synthase family protein [Streptomyces sp. B-S-A12]
MHEVERRAVEWIDSSGMCASEREKAWVVATHSADFFARFAPIADDDRLLAAVQWVYWGFAFDDARCDSGPLSNRPAQFNALAGQVQRACETDLARPEDRYARALQSITRSFRSFAPPTQVSRFVHAHRAWLSGVSWQIGNQAMGRMPGLDEFLSMRLLAAGGCPTFALLELATGAEVPDRELHRPAVSALTEMAMMVASLDNDRHSLHKELSRGQADQNIYTVLMAERGLPLQQAVDEANGLRDRVLRRFLELHDQVRPTAGTDLATYLQGLRYGLRGNNEWGLRVPRYLSQGHWPDEREDTLLEWADEPCDVRPGPPAGAPGIAWWWEADLV